MSATKQVYSVVVREYEKAIDIDFESLNHPYVMFAADLSAERVLKLVSEEFVNSGRFEVKGGW